MSDEDKQKVAEEEVLDDDYTFKDIFNKRERKLRFMTHLSGGQILLLKPFRALVGKDNDYDTKTGDHSLAGAEFADTHLAGVMHVAEQIIRDSKELADENIKIDPSHPFCVLDCSDAACGFSREDIEYTHVWVPSGWVVRHEIEIDAILIKRNRVDYSPENIDELSKGAEPPMADATISWRVRVMKN